MSGGGLYEISRASVGSLKTTTQSLTSLASTSTYFCESRDCTNRSLAYPEPSLARLHPRSAASPNSTT